MKIAVMTMVRNEKFFLPIWYKYYSKQFKRDDIYILDNDSVDGCTDGYHNVIPCKSKYIFDHEWMKNNIKIYMNYLLSIYDYVVYVDVDEILCPHPLKYLTISNFILLKNEAMTPRSLNCYRGGMKDPPLKIKTFHTTGYEVLSTHKSTEIRDDIPILRQRDIWIPINTFYKPCISMEPQEFIKDYKDEPYPSLADPNLYLIHINRISYRESYKAYLAKKKMIELWNPRDIPTTKGWQHRMKTDEEFIDYFYNPKNTCDVIKPIPEMFRNIV